LKKAICKTEICKKSPKTSKF